MSNPYNAPSRPLRSPAEAKQYSGFVKEVRVGRPERIDIDLAKIAPAGYTGMATLSVAVTDVSPALPDPAPGPAPGPVPNTVLTGTVSWASGYGGGTMPVDLTRGGVIPVGGTDHIGIELELVSSIAGEAPVLWRTKRVMLTVNWFGNANENPSYTSPGLVLDGSEATPFTSDFVPIPLMASTVILDTDTPSLLGAAFLEFSTTTDPGGTGIKYRSPLNPNATGTKIHSGVEYVRVVATGGGTFFQIGRASCRERV